MNPLAGCVQSVVPARRCEDVLLRGHEHEVACHHQPCAPAFRGADRLGSACRDDRTTGPADRRLPQRRGFLRAIGRPAERSVVAIGRIESGRTDPATNRTDPWPWATNHAGEGHYFASAQEAIAWVAAQQAIGIRSIDVGCFQVNLHYHPDAFADLAEAFDPAANARYAAALLNRLHEQGRSWPLAIALYHSADPVEGQRYSARVMQAWDAGGSFAGISTSGVVRSVDPVVVRLSAAASVVRVIVPNWAAAGPAMPPLDQRAGLPRVFVPRS
jgi:hypothetical protein